MKPYPIPVLEGEAAEEFIRDAEKPPSALEKKIMKEAKALSKTIRIVEPKKQVKKKKKQVKRK